MSDLGNLPRDFEEWFAKEHGGMTAHSFAKIFSIRESKKLLSLWELKQKEVDSLKAQLNNMEACYIEKKKEVEELRGKSRCIKSLVEQRNLAENMLRKISVAAQKKLPTFGAALRFNDEVKEILRGAND